jgi:hypothetical protein
VANEWGNSWHIIRDSIHDTVNQQFQHRYKLLDEKLGQLTNTQKQEILPNTEFYPRVVNKTDINITKEELELLNKGLKYNLQCKQKHWIRNLACEADNAVTMLPPKEQQYMRYQVARNIKKLQNHQQKQSAQMSTKIKHELKIVKQIRKKK